MPNPLVSIITPCYQQGRFLRATIESVLAQTYSPIEMIVINDGSNDDTEAVARSFSDKVKYYWQPNSGVPASPRNAGLSRSSGKYVLFLDADDMLHRDAVGWLVEAARGREDVLCLLGVERFVNDPSLDGYGQYLPSVDGPLAPKLMLCNLGQPNGILCSRLMLASIGGFCTDGNVRGCEDWLAWLRLVFAGAEIVPIRRIGAYYREHPSSLSKNRLGMVMAEAETFWRTYRWTVADPGRVVAMGGNVEDIHREIALELFHRAYHLREHSRYSASLRAYWRAILCGGLKTAPVWGIVKLIPHWAVRRIQSSDTPSGEQKRVNS